MMVWSISSEASGVFERNFIGRSLEQAEGKCNDYRAKGSVIDCLYCLPHLLLHTIFCCTEL